MAATPELSRARASEEATEWLILLQEEPDDPDVLRRFQVWHDASDVNATAWAETQRVSALIVAAPATHRAQWAGFAAATAGVADARVRPFTPRPARLRRFAGWIAGMAVAACLAVVFVPSLLIHVQADHVTGSAETRSLQLSDGSAVVLAPGSAIAVAYGEGERRVRLLAGEAFFEVAPNPARPFRVSARAVDVMVLGTGFDVRMGDDGAAVFVQHGMVRVSHTTRTPPLTDTLGAGQSVRVTWAGQATRGTEPPQLIAAWRQGQLIAQDQPMRDIVDQLRRYYSGTIVLASNGLAERRVTGAYNLANPVDALRAIARAHGATVRQITPWLLIVSES